MGTTVSIALYLPTGAARPSVEAALHDACRQLHLADEVFSTWRADSPMSRVRRGELDVADAPAAVAEVLARCDEARRLSQGWFDPWSMPGGVDPTGLVKGWAAQRALEALRVPEVVGALVNAGGDIVVRGVPTPHDHWRVGVRHPWRRTALACVARLDAAIATSATYERGAHLVDPRTGRAAAAAASATVSGPDLGLADALATALAVGGEEVLGLIESLSGYEAYLIGRDGRERSTADFPFCEADAGTPLDVGA